MAQHKENHKLTEFSPAVIDRLRTIINTNDESELRIISKTFSDIQIFINSYGQYVNFNLRITDPIQYIKPNTLGLPQTISEFEHPKVNKLVYDLDSSLPNIQISPSNFILEFYDTSEDSVIYHNRIKLQF